MLMEDLVCHRTCTTEEIVHEARLAGALTEQPDASHHSSVGTQVNEVERYLELPATDDVVRANTRNVLSIGRASVRSTTLYTGVVFAGHVMQQKATKATCVSKLCKIL